VKCEHRRVRDEALRVMVGSQRTLVQLGFCLDCREHLYRQSPFPPLGAWLTDEERSVRLSTYAATTIPLPGRR